MVWRYDKIKKNRTTSNAVVIGTTSANAPSPITGIRTRNISSVAYADDDKLSDANTASAVGLPRRSVSSASVCNGGPSSLFFNRYRTLSGGTATPGTSGVGIGRADPPIRSAGAVSVASADSDNKVSPERRATAIRPLVSCQHDTRQRGIRIASDPVKNSSIRAHRSLGRSAQ